MKEIASTALGLRRKSVLVVEDNAPVKDTLREVVEEAGFAVTTASSRSEATRLIDHQAFDIAIVDKRLVEQDTRNKDGLAVLRYIKEKAEGTVGILLTAYGEYADAVEATNELGVRILEKRMDFGILGQEILKAVRDGAVEIERFRSINSAARIWCGDEDSVIWETRAKSELKPAGGFSTLVEILNELARTCIPILEPPGSGGLAKAGDSVLTGLYWSRGIGSAVVVTLCGGKPLKKVPRLADWPEHLSIEKELYRIRRKNLLGLISRCSGVGVGDFPVNR